MKLDTPRAIVAGFLLVALAVFMSRPRYAIVENSRPADGIIAMRLDTRTGKTDACFQWIDRHRDEGYSQHRIECDGMKYWGRE